MYLKLKEMLSEYNLKVVYMEMKEPGFYYPKPRIIFLNENLYGETAEAFHLSHELAHFTASHFEYSVLYDTSTTFHSKFETEADKIAILILLNIYIENELTDESQFNLEKFM
ncbi:TPA: ImmA/IrrE family metallo-endopeptidase, partial [Enterococcus faecium]|nr:ImmA/IrrE family metallo-endopeptidase [Enterococcus faecium]HAP7767410.1 ImmA/IrrE family metallo-endopeptidase [Enterococcus faecium]HAP8850220.1 ImmA/IrrE family metallo-endopeptidase [Enterococcus faecium]